MNVLFNILNFCIASERIVLKVTIHSLENDYIKKPCQHTDNIANYNNRDVIDKIKKIENNDNEEENKILLSNIIEEYNKDVPYVSLYYNSSTLIYSNNLKGDIKPNSYNIFNNIETWYREYDK